MNKALINWWSGAGYDSALSAVMARWTALGYTHPSSAVLTSLNTLITDLKAAGVYTGFDGLWVPMLNNAAIVDTTGAINYISPSANQWTWPTPPTYTTSGFIGNGTTQYCLTNFNPSTHGSQFARDSASYGFYCYSGASGNQWAFGHAVSNSNIFMLSTAGATTQWKINSTNNLGGSVTLASRGAGYYAMNRQDSTNVTIYQELNTHAQTATSTAKINENMTLGSCVFGSTNAGFSFFFVGRSFSQAEHAAIRTAILAHKTRLGL